MSDQSSLSIPVSEEQDHILGPATAPITLVEYGDYECPHCQRAAFMLQELLPANAQSVRLVFRNFPLTQIHPHAQRAAEAAEAAGAQGKFWDMHDVLFASQEALEDENLLAYAQALKLDMARFESELAEGTHRQRVRQDFSGGIRSGVNGTPTFFLNGVRYDGSWDRDSMQAVIDQLLGGAKKGHPHKHAR